MSFYQFTLTSSTTTEVLTENPAGWKDIGKTYIRSDFYHGIFRSLTLTMRFSNVDGGGTELIEDEYNLNAIKAEVNIVIARKNLRTDDYDTIFEGILDFDPDRVTFERDFIEIGAIDGSKEKKFASRDTINYNVKSLISTDNESITDFSNSPKEIDLPPINIYLEGQTYGAQATNPTGIVSNDSDTVLYSRTINKNELGDRLISIIGEKIYENTSDEGINITLDLQSLYNITWDITGLSYPNSSTLNIQIKALYKDSGGSLQGSNVYLNETDLTANETTKEINYTDSIDDQWEVYIAPGGYVEFIGTWSVTNYQNQSIDLSFLNTINDLDIIEKYDSIATTQTLSFFPHELFTRLIQLSTSETDTSKLFYSILFGRTDSEFELYPANGNGALDAVTSVWEIRNFPDKPFNVSIRDLFKSFDSIYSIGLSYDRANERFYIESKSEFYNSSSQMFELTDVKNFVRKPYKTGYFSEIKNGINKKIEYEEIQGANEYNLNNEKTVSIPIKTTLDAQQVYNTDSIGIELPRRKQYTTNANEDTRYDENICIIRTDGTEAIQNGTSVTGFIGVDEMYNVKLTPRENLIRWGGVIKSCLWKSSEDIKQILSQKNVNINYTNRQGNNVNELDDINQSELTDQRLFNPEIYEFESAITLEILNTLDSDPHGYVRVTFNEIVYEGFVLEMQTKDYDRKATWKLLAKGVDEIVDVDNYVFENDDNYTFENDDNYIFNN